MGRRNDDVLMLLGLFYMCSTHQLSYLGLQHSLQEGSSYSLVHLSKYFSNAPGYFSDFKDITWRILLPLSSIIGLSSYLSKTVPGETCRKPTTSTAAQENVRLVYGPSPTSAVSNSGDVRLRNPRFLVCLQTSLLSHQQSSP